MNRKQVDSIWMGVSVFSFLSLSISFLLMPLGSETSNGSLSVYTLVAGIMFWVSLFLGIVTQCVLSHRRKMWYVIHRVRRLRTGQKTGLVSFFENPFAAVADIALIITLIGLIITVVLAQGGEYLYYILISVLVFSFSMHCILNGKTFYHVTNQNKMLHAIKNERADLSKEERKEKNG